MWHFERKGMNNTPWKYTIKFINNYVGEGEIFFTSDHLNYVRKYKTVAAQTLYWHRVILQRLGFLEQTHEKGVWLKLKTFPYDVGKAQAELCAFPKYGWESWFIPPGWPLKEKYKSEVTNGR